MIYDSLYLPNIAFFCTLQNKQNIIIDIHSHYQKQSYRNRTQILGTQGILDLIIPVHKTDHFTQMGEVTIDYGQAWVRQHIGAIKSAYGKSPFFEYYFSYFEAILQKKHDYLYQLNSEILTVCLKILKINCTINFSEKYQATIENDFRNSFHPKKNTKINNFTSYPQLFGELFVNNLSIIDLIMNEGPHAKMYLMANEVFLNDMRVNHV